MNGFEKDKRNDESITFYVNGTLQKVEGKINPDDRLVDYLRRTAMLTGTKWMCREGGCGSCVVVMAENEKYRAVNSCLLPLLACHGRKIITIEGIGSKKNGFHPLQSRLAEMNGSQCGFCSPGMVMSIFGLKKETRDEFTVKDVERALEGHICRCTGYRPILDAFKTFAKDGANVEFKCPLNGDIEDLMMYNNNGRMVSAIPRLQMMGNNWFRPESLDQLVKLLGSLGNGIKYRLVAGNTGTGVFKNDGPYDVYVDINRVGELKEITESTPMTIGGGVTLSDLHRILDSIPSTNGGYWYGPILANHVAKIGSVPVRNLASIAGSLMLKHGHNEFPSDTFLVLETVGTRINLINERGYHLELSLTEFLKMDMKGCIIHSLILPPLSKDHVIKTYKIMPRSSNAHAYINAGFCFKLQSNRIVEKPTIIYGGIRPSLIHAEKTEDYFIGKTLEDVMEFQGALKVLEEELQPEADLLNPDGSYLISVAQGLLYKFVLSILGDKVSSKMQSGATDLERGLSSGKQDYETDLNEWPINQPAVKVDAKTQCSGEIQYVDDIPLRADELHGAFVYSSVANCWIDSIDPSKALKSDGVVSYIDANNMKQRNQGALIGVGFDTSEEEEIFCSGRVVFAGQIIGLVIARTQMEAIRAAKLVQVTYKDLQKPILTIKEALKYPERIVDHTHFGPADMCNVGDPEEGWASSEEIIEGEFEIGSQYHFPLETLVTVCIPLEDGMDVYCATQNQDAVQTVIANCLNLKKSKVNVQTRRLGGSFGMKITRATLVAAACSIAAAELGKPVRIHLDLNSCMTLVGGRMPYYCKYKAGIDGNGLIQAVDMTIIADCGSNYNEGCAIAAASVAKNCYGSKAWIFRPKLAKTDTPSNTYCRAPGPTQGIAIIENLVEHLAKFRREDPFQFRMKNMNRNNPEVILLENVLDQLRNSSDYDQRLYEVKEFNRNNRWKKRGINFLPMIYPVEYPSFHYNVQVAVFHNDGSVAVSHGGIESGQGVNTKITQVVARELVLDFEMISIKSTNVFTNPNGSLAGGSVTSELNCYGAMRACQDLKERMRPIREKMPDADWITLVNECYKADIDLTARHYYSPSDGVKEYVVHTGVISEVEVDVLTGEKMIRRVDILEDAGQSINPLLDIGQVEGAFVMGIGLWTSEILKYNPETGEKLTCGTWDYKPPLHGDIPRDFRVTLLKNAAHSFGVLRSKATGEPPICLASSVFFALRNAVDDARRDAGELDWYQMDGPATVDKLQKMMLVKSSDFTFS